MRRIMDLRIYSYILGITPLRFCFAPIRSCYFRVFVNCSELLLGLFLAMIYDLRMMMGDGRSCLVANHFSSFPPRLVPDSPAKGISQQLICRIYYLSLTSPFTSSTRIIVATL